MMAATIKIGLFTATIEKYNWTSENESLAELLNSMLPIYGPSGSDPNPDHTAAVEAVNLLGGEVVSFDQLPYVDGRIY